eukprot:5815886-Ditylum_brightwellii.AAC.1
MEDVKKYWQMIGEMQWAVVRIHGTRTVTRIYSIVRMTWIPRRHASARMTWIPRSHAIARMTWIPRRHTI